jgi:hypothetical protein
MSKAATYNVFLDKELWQDDLAAGLVRMGHTVHELSTMPGDIYISQRAWRVPSDVGSAKLVAHIESVLKQVRVLDRENQTISKPEATDPKPSGAAKRKSKAKVPAGVPGGAVQD